MSQHDEGIETNIPTKGSWEDDWARAEAAANEHEADQEAADEHASKQEAQHSGSQGANDDGAEDSEGSGGEEGLESAPQAEGGSSEPDLGSEDGQGEGARGHERQRQVSRDGRQRREQHQSKSQGSVEDEETWETLRGAAEKLGLEVDDKHVSVPDRVAFRAERRELKKKLAERESQLEERVALREKALQERYGKSLELQEALDARDLDRVAKIAGYEDFGQMSVAHVQRRMSPEQQEMLQLRAELQKEKREREAYARAQQAEQAKRARAQDIAEYKLDLKDELSTHEDPAIADFAQEDSFVDMVYEVQRRHYDPQSEDTIATADAAALVVDELKKTYTRMHSRFGNQAASQPEKQPSSGAAAEKPGRRPPTNVSQNEAADASEAEDSSQLDQLAWERKWGARLKESTPAN